MGKGYYVGLDMGTGSVGWAVTDESYQILRRHGKAMWGVRLFESAKTAEERRMFRTGRRRLDRRGWRIEILQEIFAEEISRVDPGFFLRMKESKYYPEDKRDIQGNCPELPYTLFVDKTFTDKDFHKKYPTIYHLRKMLMETEDTPDMRLVYLALHHMMKHRGHFLLSGDISQVTEFKNTFNQFIENIRNEEMDFEIELDESAVQMIEETLKDKNLTRSAKKSKLVKGLNAKNVRDKAFLTLLSGGTVKLSDLFGMEELNEGERPKISFADNGYEEYAAVVEMELGELYYIVESAKAVYDWAILSDILGGSTSISDAKVRAYEKHKADTTKVALNEIAVVLIESTAVSLTTSLLAELTKRKVKVIFCDEKRNPSSELVSYYGSHDTSNKIRKQIAWRQNTKEAVWTEIVSEKIRKQKELLELLGKEEAELLSSYLQQIAWNDETNREGHAAKVYFNALFGLDFTRTEDNLINAALNYGYSIILSSFTREIVANGYITQLGLFHDNMFNQFNLASDLMEPFRPLVDKCVLGMKLEQFEHEEKMWLVDILNQEVQIDGKIQYVSNAIKIYCKSVFDALNEDDSALVRFYKIEL